VFGDLLLKGIISCNAPPCTENSTQHTSSRRYTAK